jgi:hypothetical protein
MIYVLTNLSSIGHFERFHRRTRLLSSSVTTLTNLQSFNPFYLEVNILVFQIAFNENMFTFFFSITFQLI